jgi:hypothetical protein
MELDFRPTSSVNNLENNIFNNKFRNIGTVLSLSVHTVPVLKFMLCKFPGWVKPEVLLYENITKAE